MVLHLVVKILVNTSTRESLETTLISLGLLAALSPKIYRRINYPKQSTDH